MASDTTKKTARKASSNHSELTVFNYPEHGISVEAYSREEADKELAARLDSLNDIKAAQGDEESE